MNTVYQFLRLIRFANILVIVLTMTLFYRLIICCFHVNPSALCYISIDQSEYEMSFIQTLGWTDINFLILIISVVLIAASGNLINDYFDQKADRVNKPGRMIIDKYIKRRWAIILNWTFNGIGFLMAAYLSFHLQNWWILIVSFLSINLLYFYSAIFKRKLLIGNVIVAGLTAIIPIYVYLYFFHSNFGDAPPLKSEYLVTSFNVKVVVIAYAIFAFALNFIREIVKDMADVKGDLLLKSQTLPIKLGFKLSKIILVVLYLLSVAPLLMLTLHWALESILYQSWDLPDYFYGLIFLSALCVMISLVVLISYNRPKYYLLASNLIKFAMLFGVLSALFI